MPHSKNQFAIKLIIKNDKYKIENLGRISKGSTLSLQKHTTGYNPEILSFTP
jgi:hypothetical protein